MASENEGLDLFDETASAAGSFPTAAWGGYNKTSVDEYLRSLENQIADLKRVQRDLRRTVEQQRIELDKPVLTDFTNLGSHTTQILSTAEAQARSPRPASRPPISARRHSRTPTTCAPRPWPIPTGCASVGTPRPARSPNAVGSRPMLWSPRQPNRRRR